uniref:Uncharacterized protein n=1 Tax=Arundo donax TaxID=35708 RepID=A0A0A9AG67_ARUDO
MLRKLNSTAKHYTTCYNLPKQMLTCSGDIQNN